MGGGKHSCPSQVKLTSLFTNGFAQWLGNISFEFFLLHQLIIRYLSALARRIFTGESWVTYFITYVIAFVLCCCLAVFYRIFSKEHKE